MTGQSEIGRNCDQSIVRRFRKREGEKKRKKKGRRKRKDQFVWDVAKTVYGQCEMLLKIVTSHYEKIAKTATS